MRAPLPALLALAAVTTLGGCSDDPAGNPRTLWLALDGSETRVRLVDVEPHPY